MWEEACGDGRGRYGVAEVILGGDEGWVVVDGSGRVFAVKFEG